MRPRAHDFAAGIAATPKELRSGLSGPQTPISCLRSASRLRSVGS
ncbi:hypothetical protein PhaeoP75_03161 [Phaeobacter gallaeciensis]|uniref:Uncharacterized protein n=1 Tax=Phaeobacter gallaeciensis TaxID=60890 RepID=A0AAD0EE10_9RHOB|nr:hypothetical protein Gal_03124 [Phaeobacter gallaeciensis DSM 26640]ATE94115.1 hypothetical protein PhaeoP11_03112 [Phaeobacter gallaeciensis]ATE96064.1 hypothetical protein PhaeoP73_00735 [Phaeobacter gallaeciensis]ATF02779.1 hypothetical protein PhaeoP75_03161 [Phaeobacter gallaeciensis]ATF07159.1 hypothetical protein PhaeoP63_03110 [Phaeobacter gallaeciensis]